MNDTVISIFDVIKNIALAVLAVIRAVLPVFIAVSSIYILYYVIKMLLIKRLRYTREFSVTGVFEGEEVTIIETIYNPNPLPLFFIDVESYIDNSLKLENREESHSAMQLIISRFHLMPFMKTTRRHKVTCIHRGYYKMSSASVLIKSIIFESVKDFDFKAELYVYPKIMEYEQMPNPINFIQGESLSLRRVLSDPFSISGIRDYLSGDPFNVINFKATAKYGFQGIQSIKVNKFDYCSNRIFMIYINLQTPDEAKMSLEQYENLIEYGLSLAASLISKALKSGYKAGLAANCRLVSGEMYIMFPVAGGLYNLEGILKEMAKTKIRCGISFQSLLKRGMKSEVFNTETFVITPYIDDDIDECITLLKKRNAVTVIKL